MLTGSKGEFSICQGAELSFATSLKCKIENSKTLVSNLSGQWIE